MSRRFSRVRRTSSVALHRVLHMQCNLIAGGNAARAFLNCTSHECISLGLHLVDILCLAAFLRKHRLLHYRLSVAPQMRSTPRCTASDSNRVAEKEIRDVADTP